jgi:hypothetical protein
MGLKEFSTPSNQCDQTCPWQLVCSRTTKPVGHGLISLQVPTENFPFLKEILFCEMKSENFLNILFSIT